MFAPRQLAPSAAATAAPSRDPSLARRAQRAMASTPKPTPEVLDALQAMVDDYDAAPGTAPAPSPTGVARSLVHPTSMERSTVEPADKLLPRAPAPVVLRRKARFAHQMRQRRPRQQAVTLQRSGHSLTMNKADAVAVAVLGSEGRALFHLRRINVLLDGKPKSMNLDQARGLLAAAPRFGNESSERRLSADGRRLFLFKVMAV